jgi:RNA polymerase sigma factor (sigma-70 family)
MTDIEHASDDLAFVQALSDGDAMAVLAFEQKFKPVVRHAFGRAFSRWRPDQPVEAGDYVQDFIGFLFEDGGRRLRSFSGKARFTTWLYTVSLRYFQRALSRLAKDRRSPAELTLLPDYGRVSPEQALQKEEEAHRLRNAVRQLPESEQLYVRLFFVEGLNATEVAQACGQGASAVRMRKMRIIDKLRDILGGGH